MDLNTAASLLGVASDAGVDEIRRAYRRRVAEHHPDRTGIDDASAMHRVVEAYGVLSRRAPYAGTGERTGTDRAGSPIVEPRSSGTSEAPPLRLDAETIAVAAPADETFRLLLDAAHDVGEITYLDRSVPIIEVLCRFVGEPATSLVLTVQGRASHTEIFCTVESIEARPAPPVAAVVDLLEDAVRARWR